MQIELKTIEEYGQAGATKVRNGLHAFGTAHPFVFGTAILIVAEVLAHFHVHF